MHVVAARTAKELVLAVASARESPTAFAARTAALLVEKSTGMSISTSRRCAIHADAMASLNAGLSVVVRRHGGD